MHYACVVTEPRVQVVVRLSASGVAELDRIAEDEERTRSQVIRMLLREALEARSRR